MTAMRSLVLCTLALLGFACSQADPGPAPLSGTVVQLTDHLDEKGIVSGQAPMAARRQLRWGFHEPQPDWQALSTERLPRLATVSTSSEEGHLLVSIAPPPVQMSMMLIGGIETTLDEPLRLGEWEAVLVRARSHDQFGGITVAYNLDAEGAVPGDMFFFFSTDEAPPVFSDGSEQTYAIPLRPREGDDGDTPFDSLAIALATMDPAAIEISSVELVPRGAAYLDDYGVQSVVRDDQTRTALFAHTPADLSYSVTVPVNGRLDFGLSTDSGQDVTFGVTARRGDKEERLFEETVGDSEAWQQRSVDLGDLAGETVDLTLSATSDETGAVGLWGAPVLSGGGESDRPNVIFYVIDGGGADQMSVYGYERRTTPLLEELAKEGAVFERAFSNATWTQPSTVSFMTSLQHSVLGGLRRGIHSTPLPEAATPMAEHMRRGGYQTSSFTSNPNSGRIIGLERGVDVMRDGNPENHSTSTIELHREYWKWREAYPGTPAWTHFQTTDVHEPNHPVEPYAGTWISEDEVHQAEQWNQQMFQVAGGLFGRASIMKFYDTGIERAGIPRQDYFGARRDLYDETMLHQDQKLADFIGELKARGEWENTLLIIGADHGHPAGSFARWGRGLFDPQPDPWEGALFDAYASRVPLIFIWPAKIPAGLRFDQPVSMIDVLPTLLDLVDLPQPEVLQGQSLAPLLTGGSQEVRPVILDEFRVTEDSGEWIGNLEIVDGRWGASLEIGPVAEGADPDLGRHAVPVGGRWGATHENYPDAPRLLLYDLENDPFARKAVNDEHPELVEKYRALLLEQWAAHKALSGQFQEAGEVTLSPEQLNQLRSLGYIQ